MHSLDYKNIGKMARIMSICQKHNKYLADIGKLHNFASSNKKNGHEIYQLCYFNYFILRYCNKAV